MTKSKLVHWDDVAKWIEDNGNDYAGSSPRGSHDMCCAPSLQSGELLEAMQAEVLCVETNELTTALELIKAIEENQATDAIEIERLSAENDAMRAELKAVASYRELVSRLHELEVAARDRGRC